MSDSGFKGKLHEKKWKRSHEKEIYERWQNKKQYSKAFKEGKVFIIDTPPPYPSGRWHVGGALHYAQIDMIARYWRMSRGNLWFPVGIDRNGLPIEGRTEKDLGISAHKTPRKKFLELCKKKLNEYEHNIFDIMSLLGLSVDWSEVYRTDSPEYRTLTQSTFIELWKKGLIYEDTKPNNWCPGCRTTLADAEVEYRVGKSRLVYIKFSLKEGGHIIIATTRPEMIGACHAIIVHPESKWANKSGQTALVPLYDREVPVIARTEANLEFGTGALMTCSYGDQEDVKLFRELKLPETIIVDESGCMSKEAGKYQGMSSDEARDAVIKDLEAGGFVEKTEKIEHNIPVCWRSKDDIELIALPEFYLKQEEFVGDLLKLADDMKFHPPKMKQLLIDWLNSISQDWPISRRRFYGTPVPVFYCGEHGAWVPKPGKYYESWQEELPCPECKKPCKGDRRVLDTWMDSSISALWISGYGRDDKFFKKNFPVLLRPQGKDIVRTWLSYSLLRAYQLTGKKAFDNVWISGHIVDEHGKKMSKSLGNVMYPEPLIEKYGADALRFHGAAEAKLGSDIRMSEERVAGSAKFVQKLYNVSRFISMFPEGDESSLKPADNWILAELGKTIARSVKGYEDMDLFVPANEIRTFVWELFAPHYLEMVKSRAYEGDPGACCALHTTLKAVLRLIAPIMPFVTDYIYHELYGESIHAQGIPKPVAINGHPTRELIEFNEKVWAEKKSKGKSLKDEIKMKVPENLKAYEADLKRMHNIG